MAFDSRLRSTWPTSAGSECTRAGGVIDRQPQSLAGGEAGEVAPQLLEQRRQLEVGELELDGAGLELADVEQRVEQPRHRVDGLLLLAQHLEAFRVADHAAQGAVQQPERLQRLAQVVARGGEEAALGEIGVLGFAARVAAAPARPACAR